MQLLIEGDERKLWSPIPITQAILTLQPLQPAPGQIVSNQFKASQIRSLGSHSYISDL